MHGYVAACAAATAWCRHPLTCLPMCRTPGGTPLRRSMRLMELRRCVRTAVYDRSTKSRRVGRLRGVDGEGEGDSNGGGGASAATTAATAGSGKSGKASRKGSHAGHASSSPPSRPKSTTSVRSARGRMSLGASVHQASRCYCGPLDTDTRNTHPRPCPASYQACAGRFGACTVGIGCAVATGAAAEATAHGRVCGDLLCANVCMPRYFLFPGGHTSFVRASRSTGRPAANAA